MPWRKLHLSIDPEMNIRGAEITETDISDIEELEALLQAKDDQPIDKVIADGGYYSIEGVEKLHEKGITPVIPPPIHAVVHGKKLQDGMTKLFNILKTKEQCMHFIRSTVMAQELWSRHRFHALKDVLGPA